MHGSKHMYNKHKFRSISVIKKFTTDTSFKKTLQHSVTFQQLTSDGILL